MPDRLVRDSRRFPDCRLGSSYGSGADPVEADRAALRLSAKADNQAPLVFDSGRRPWELAC